jgi:hypothetical protein
VFNAGSNPNYTRSYGYSIEPTEHTGVLGSYQINKLIGVSAGIANTWSAGINARSARTESSKTYMAAVTLTAPDDMGFLAGSALYAGIMDGYNSFVGNDVTSYYLGATLATPIKQLKVGAAWDYSHAHDNSFGPAGYAQAVALYASIQATEKLSFHARAEWADFTDSIATGGSANSPFLNTSTTPATLTTGTGGVPSEVLALTGTIQYDLWANVLTRLEIRWDTALSGRPFGGTGTGAAVGVDDTGATFRNPGGADQKNSVLVAANIIYKF